MKLVKISSPIKQTAFKDADGILEVEEPRYVDISNPFNYDTQFQFKEDFYILNPYVIKGHGNPTYIGQESGKTFYKCYTQEFFVDFPKNPNAINCGRVFSTGYGQDLGGLVKQINYYLLHPFEKSNVSRTYYLIYDMKYSDIRKPFLNWESLIVDTIENHIEFIKDNKKQKLYSKKTTIHKTTRKPTGIKSLQNAYKKML